MKCFILLTFVALCYSYPYGYETGYGYRSGRNININEDGTIVITGANGKKITITKGMGTSGQKNVDISVSGPGIPTKRIQINEQNKLSVTGHGEIGDSREYSDDFLRDKRSSKDSRKQKNQGDTLTKILAVYQGDVDQDTYQQLLDDVNIAVQEGQLSPSVYNVLQSLDQVQGQVGQRGYWTKQGIIGQRPANVLDLLREQAIEQELQQLQREQLLRQGVRTPLYVTGQRTPFGLRSQVGVPVDVDQQKEIVERALLWGPQGVRGLGVGGVGGIITGTGSGAGRTIWRPSVTGLLSRQSQYGQIGPIGQSIPSQLSEVIQEEREVLSQQRQIQQQQLQQQQEQEQLLVQQLVQQQQQEQQQHQQQLLQQLQLQQLQEQEQLLEQQQTNDMKDYLLSGGRTSIPTRGQQGLWQQQPDVYSPRGLYGGYGQGIQRIQRYNVPFVL